MVVNSSLYGNALSSPDQDDAQNALWRLINAAWETLLSLLDIWDHVAGGAMVGEGMCLPFISYATPPTTTSPPVQSSRPVDVTLSPHAAVNGAILELFVMGCTQPHNRVLASNATTYLLVGG